jgi:hypothetical protein
MDKRSESQFVAVASTVHAPQKVDGQMTRVGRVGQAHAGTAPDVMKQVAAEGRLFQKHNEGPRSLIKEGDPKWGVEVRTSSRPGGPARETTTKEGRRGVAADLGLPNKKEYRAKKKKG